jgi:hypothetical protein
MGKMTQSHVGTMSPLAGKEMRMPEKGPKIMSEMHIKPMVGGGHVVIHHFASPTHSEGGEHSPEMHEFPQSKGAEALAHIGKEMGIKGSGTHVEDTEDAEKQD